MPTLDTTLRHLEGDAIPVRLGDAVRSSDGTPLGSVDRAIVTPDLRHISHVGVQPEHRWEWPRLVPIADLSRGAVEDDKTLVLVTADQWPEGFRRADMIPGLREADYPDHPRHPLSPVQQFALALLSPGLAGELGVAARIRERLPDGETALRTGSSLLGWAGRAVGKVGEVLGLVTTPEGDVSEVLVIHRHHLGRRMARLPIDEVAHAGIDEATTPLTPHDLERFDVATDG